MSILLNRQDVLSLENASQFTNNLQQLNYFVRNVQLQMPSFSRSQDLNYLSGQIMRSFTSHRTKSLNSWIHFVERLNNENFGITPVHLALLTLLVRQGYYKHAIKMIETPGLPISISISKYRQYLMLSAQVYIEYQKYKEAIESLTMANSIEDSTIELSMYGLQLLVLTKRVIGLGNDNRDFMRDVDKIRASSHFEIQEMIRLQPQKVSQLELQVQIFSAICQQKQLQQNELYHLKRKLLFQIYKKGCNKRAKLLKAYIKQQVKTPILYRIKCTQINNQEISSFQTVRDINKYMPIYKYDSRNNIMYFQHQTATQQEIDAMINQASMMQQIIKKRPVEIRGSERQREHTLNNQMMGGYEGRGVFSMMFDKIDSLLGSNRR